MKSNSPISPPTPPPFIWWILWTAMMTGVPIFYFSLEGTHGKASVPAVMAGALMALPLLMGTFLRWVIVQRTEKGVIAFKAFIIGMALAEGVCLYGIFLFPQYKLLATVLSIAGMFQFIPLYAGRFNAPPKR